MTHEIRTRHPLLREVEVEGFRQLRQYRRCAQIDPRQISFYRRLAHGAVTDIRAARRTQAEIG